MGSQENLATALEEGRSTPRQSAGHWCPSTVVSNASSWCAGPRRRRAPGRSPQSHSGGSTTRFPAFTGDRDIHNAMRNRRPVQALPSMDSDKEFCPDGRDAKHLRTGRSSRSSQASDSPKPPLAWNLALGLLVARLRHWKVWKRRVAKRSPFRAEIVNPERVGLEAQSQLCLKQ